MKEYAKFGKFAYLVKLRNGIWRNMGGCLAPVNAYLNIIGMETLGLRMERICSNALALAQALEQLEGVTVNYPLLKSNPYHKIAGDQFGNKGGGPDDPCRFQGESLCSDQQAEICKDCHQYR